MKKAYVTGATGCVGRNLVDVLLRDDWHVIALHRASSDLSRLDGCDVETRKVDLHSVASVMEATTDGADAMFHCAANVKHHPKYHADQYLDNVVATKNLCLPCLQGGSVGRFVYCSTGAVGFGFGLTDEEVGRIDNGYVRTKILAERLVRRHVDCGVIDAVVLRPIIVIGRYDWNNYRKTFDMIAAGKLPFSLPGQLEFCHAEDVAKAHLSAYERGVSGGHYWLGGEFLSWHEFFGKVADAMGVARPRSAPPVWVMRVLAHAFMLAERLTGKEAEITPELVSLISTKGARVNELDRARSAVELGYQSRSAREAIDDCLDWSGYSCVSKRE